MIHTVVQATKKEVTATKLIQLSINHFHKMYQVIGFQVNALHNPAHIKESEKIFQVNILLKKLLGIILFIILISNIIPIKIGSISTNHFNDFIEDVFNFSVFIFIKQY